VIDAAPLGHGLRLEYYVSAPLGSAYDNILIAVRGYPRGANRTFDTAAKAAYLFTKRNLPPQSNEAAMLTESARIMVLNRNPISPCSVARRRSFFAVMLQSETWKVMPSTNEK
jgi:hypothetical protein